MVSFCLFFKAYIGAELTETTAGSVFESSDLRKGRDVDCAFEDWQLGVHVGFVVFCSESIYHEFYIVCF